MNRRSFFKALGAAVVIVAAPPVAVAEPTVLATGIPPFTENFYWVDLANAIAFNLVGEFIPEHQGHYRQRSLAAAHRYLKAQGIR
jgi:hypothetical protein